MVFVNKTYDPKEIEELGFVLEDDIVKEKIGEETVVVSETDKRLVKAIKTKLNWTLLGPAVAVMLFVFSWGTVISERAYTATVNVDNIEKLDNKFIKQNDKISFLTKIIIQQEEIIKSLQKNADVVEKYTNKSLDDLRFEIRMLKGK
jgi:hypothetical protein